MPRVKLTPRQQEILNFIRNNIEILGLPPTRLEITQAFGFASPNAAEEHLKALAQKGVIILEPGAARGIRLVEQLGLPLVGNVAAGSPILAQEHIQARYPVAADLFSPRADFLLKVQGLSMIDAGIFEGDLVAVHQTEQIHNGQIVVARLGDDVTIKRWKKQNDIIELLPENPDYDPIVIDCERDQLVIEGIVVGLIRGGKSISKS